MARGKNQKKIPSSEELKRFAMLQAMITSDLQEVRELSKKKQDEPLNKFKVQLINKKLELIKEILKNEPTAEFLNILDESSLPSNSDAVLLISQFMSAMDQFQLRHASPDNLNHRLKSQKISWKGTDEDEIPF